VRDGAQKTPREWFDEMKPLAGKAGFCTLLRMGKEGEQVEEEVLADDFWMHHLTSIFHAGMSITTRLAGGMAQRNLNGCY